VTGWGWFYPSTILDDFSRYIIAWKLCTTMRTEDVTDTLGLALQASGLDQATVMHRPRLLSDNGSSYVSSDLAEWLEGQNMQHTRGAPYHPMTQGKSSAGIKRSKIAFCSRTIICPATLSPSERMRGGAILASGTPRLHAEIGDTGVIC
jgi:transposase InsO family protein